MESDRRSSSIEAVLVSLGKLEEASGTIKATVIDLNTRVGIQNGKVAKLEKWQSFIQGAIAILILMIVPIIINFVSSWLNFTFHK